MGRALALEGSDALTALAVAISGTGPALIDTYFTTYRENMQTSPAASENWRVDKFDDPPQAIVRGVCCNCWRRRTIPQCAEISPTLVNVAMDWIITAAKSAGSDVMRSKLTSSAAMTATMPIAILWRSCLS